MHILKSILFSYNPPLVGVVGPNHSGGKLEILTYDFVHRTHVDIFGFYYPHVFGDWFADNWITGVYKPERCETISCHGSIISLLTGYHNDVWKTRFVFYVITIGVYYTVKKLLSI